MYRGQVIFSELSATESITAAIEFVPIADMYGVSGMEVQMAEAHQSSRPCQLCSVQQRNCFDG